MHYAAFLAITILAVISPGADFAMVSRASSLRGHRAGLTVALGIGVSCWIHVAYAVFLLATIERLMPSFMLVVRLVGAGYLAYAGARMLLATACTPPDTDVPQITPRSRDFLNGFLTNALNPKTIVFVVSLFSQVIGSHTPYWFQLLCGATISFCHTGWFAIVAYGLSRATVQRWVKAHELVFNRSIGTILIGIGASLPFV